MLYEFAGQLANVKGLLEQGVSIAGNEATDSIDLTVLDIYPEELASACFNNSGETTVPQTIAQREAFDFVVSHQRLMTVHAMDRAAYYTRAGSEFATIMSRYDYLNAVLQRMDRKGTP